MSYRDLRLLLKDKTKRIKNAGISLHPDLVNAIDNVRGFVPRSIYVADVLQRSLFSENKESKTVAVLTRPSHQSQTLHQKANPNADK
jgi:hypothetical protein